MGIIGTLYSFVSGQKIQSAQVNQNFTDIKSAFNSTAVLTDTAKTITARHLMTGGLDVAGLRVNGPVFDPTHPTFGAKGDGTTDDTTALDNCRLAAQAVGGVMEVPPGTYKRTTAFTITAPMTLHGVYGASVFLFTGATDGIVIADGTANAPIEGIEVRTSNAGAGSAVKVVQHLNAQLGLGIRDVLVSFTGAGRWAKGGEFSNFQSAEVRNLRVSQSATVGVHIGPDSCGALNFHDLNVTGSGGAGTITRAVEVDGTSDCNFIGGVLQGYFTKSLVWMSDAGPRFYGTHFENSNGTPSDGFDVVATGTAVSRAGFYGCQGGSIGLGIGATTVRACEIVGGEMGPITLSATSAGCSVLGVRCGTGVITDNGAGANTILGCSNGSGVALANKVPGHFVAASATTIPVANYTGGNAMSVEFSGAFGSIDNLGNLLQLLFLGGAGQTYLQYLAQLNIRDTAGVQRATLTNSGVNSSFDLAGAAALYSIAGTKVIGPRGAAVADIASPNATDLASAVLLANETKAQVNTALARLRAATGHGLIA